jgi:hypothetical protein
MNNRPKRYVAEVAGSAARAVSHAGTVDRERPGPTWSHDTCATLSLRYRRDNILST